MTDEKRPLEPNNGDSMSKERQRIYDRQISPMLSGSVEGALIDVPLTPEEEALFSKIEAERIARKKENRTWDIKWVMEQEEEYDNWDDYIGRQCANLARQTNEAKDAGNLVLAEKLDREWKGWILLNRLGLNRAGETALGKKALLDIYEKKQAIEKKSAAYRKDSEEREAREIPLWNAEIERLWSDLSERILDARDAGDQELLKKLLQESEELGRTKTSGYDRTSSTKLGQEILNKIRKESDS